MGLGDLIPSLFLNRNGAPSNPRKAAFAMGAGAVFIAVVLAVMVPNSFLPGIADSKVEGSTMTIEWEGGDRYFWLPAATATRVTASMFVDEMPGNQTITKRSTYNSVERSTFDEAEGGTDFPLETNFLYEVAGGFSDESIVYAAQPGTVGKSFMQDIKDNSNQFMRRLGSYVLSLPGIVWDDMKQVGGDFAALFHKGGIETCAEGDADCVKESKDGAVAAFAERVVDNWPILVGILVLLVFAPLFGVDNVYLGALAGLAFATAGFWWLAAASVALGFLMDNNRQLDDQNLTQRIGTRVGESVVDFGRDNPRVVGAVVVFLVALAAGVAATYLGYANLTAAIVVVGGVATTLMIATSGRNSRGQFTLLHLGIAPAIAMFLLAGINAAWLLFLGYESFGWGLLIVSLFGAAMWINTKNKAANAKLGGKSYNPAKRRRELKEEGWARYHELSVGVKVGAFIGAAAVWLAVAAIASHDYLVAGAYLVIGLALLAAFTYLIWPSMGEGLEDEEEDEPEETRAATLIGASEVNN